MDKYTIIVAVISVLALVQRLLREDVKWFPTLTTPWRGLVVAMLGLVVAPVLDAVLNGTAVAQAIIAGIIAVLPTILNIIGSFTATKSAPKLAAGAGMLLMLAICVVGCASTCPIIHLADQVCPYVIAKQQDGTEVRIPKAEFTRLANTYKGATLVDREACK
jgi:hypothetical protein